MEPTEVCALAGIDLGKNFALHSHYLILYLQIHLKSMAASIGSFKTKLIGDMFLWVLDVDWLMQIAFLALKLFSVSAFILRHAWVRQAKGMYLVYSILSLIIQAMYCLTMGTHSEKIHH